VSLRNVGIIYRKELTDSLRDRRTLISSIVVPILSFPLLMLAIIGIAVLVISKTTQQQQVVALIHPEQAPELAQRLRRARNLRVTGDAENYVQRINDKNLQAAVEFPAGMEEKIRTSPEEPQTVKIYVYEGEIRSTTAAKAVESAVRQYREDIVTQRISSRGLDAGALQPFATDKRNVASAEKVTGNVIGFILPYFIIILCLTGAMYPAIDMTAGEKERGTMETILASPVGRGELVIGKFLLTLTASLVTTALSIISLGLTVLAVPVLVSQLSKNFVVAVSIKAAAAVFFLILPLAIVFAATLMALALRARNYREAQTQIGPLMFLVILPAMAAMIPGMELNQRLALIPVMNVSLAAKEILAGNYPWQFIGLIFGSTCVYAAAALFYARRQFDNEEVIFRT
jgi:sodium transport system permease protein